MTILDFEYAIRRYGELRDDAVEQKDAIKMLFDSEFGQLELIKAVEVIDQQTTAEARKSVVRALAN